MYNKDFRYFYSIFQDVYTLDHRAHIGFGIIVVSIPNNKIELKIEDITTSKCALCSLVQLCNELSLDPIHIYDVIEDFLS